MKKQTEYTFKEARDTAKQSLSALASFAESLHSQFLDKTLLEWAISLQEIATKVKNASGPCLSDSEIKLVWGFGQELIAANPELASQLAQFWSLYSDIVHILRLKKSSPGYAPRAIISQLGPRIDQVETLAESMVSAGKSQASGILFPTALLLVHVVRTETIEFALLKQLEDAVEKHSLKDKYDVKSIVSVESKVKKGNDWRTDIRAIRDATAHGQFRIQLLENDWAIDFNNDGKGYAFHKRFSRKEFMKFFDLHTMLYKFQLHLLIILESLTILATHFHVRT